MKSEIVVNAAVERCRGDEAHPVWELRHVSHNGGCSCLSGLPACLVRGWLAWIEVPVYLCIVGERSTTPLTR